MAGMNTVSVPELKPPNVGVAPNQPLKCVFPMRTFGQKKMVKRSFNRNWFSNWHWLHYDSSQDLSFCHTCVKAVNEGKLSLASGNIKDSPFVCGGFSNSKDAFARHEQTTTHKKAVEVLVTIPETTRDIGEMLSTAHAEGKKISGQCLVTIAENKRFLARQGIALRGDEDEKDSNFIQLLHLLAIKQPELINWMQQKTSKYTSACSDSK